MFNKPMQIKVLCFSVLAILLLLMTQPFVICATLQDSLDTWLGSTIEDVISFTGSPPQVSQINGRSYFTWFNSRQIVLPGQINTYGNINTVGNYGYLNSTSSVSPPTVINRMCQTTFTADSQGIINKAVSTGNGCREDAWVNPYPKQYSGVQDVAILSSMEGSYKGNAFKVNSSGIYPKEVSTQFTLSLNNGLLTGEITQSEGSQEIKIPLDTVTVLSENDIKLCYTIPIAQEVKPNKFVQWWNGSIPQNQKAFIRAKIYNGHLVGNLTVNDYSQENAWDLKKEMATAKPPLASSDNAQ